MDGQLMLAGRESRLAWWREQMAQQAASGQGVRAYCAANGIPETRWYYWRKALQPARSVTDGFVELKAPVRNGLVVECGGCRIGVARGFDAILLRDVVASLRDA